MKGRRILLTGTWGTGKTALLKRLDAHVKTVSEWGRVLAAEQIAFDEFTTRMLAYSIADYDRLHDHSGDVVFDRGIPDAWAYARWF
ncbi:MAG TPA: AAA family ATPase, partial [Acidimicrobiia bacterium]|nr:AAA family ATPase [Acidimicrobiia bacterium]